MKFTIREMMLVTVVIAVLFGWLVDHWRAAAKDAAWEKAFEKPMEALSLHAREVMTFETPGGPWRLDPNIGVIEKRSR